MNAIFNSSPAPVLSGAFVRELAPQDLVVLEGTAKGVKAPTLQRIRDIHHQVAMLLAKGVRPVEVSRITGMCQSRISILKADPTFQELLEYYREIKQAADVDDLQRINMLGRGAVQELLRRMEESPEELADTTLLKLAEFSADRTGKGPTTKNITATAVLSAADIEALKREGAESGVKLISAEDREASGRLSLRGSAVQEGDCIEAEFTEAGAELREESSPAPQAAE